MISTYCHPSQEVNLVLSIGVILIRGVRVKFVSVYEKKFLVLSTKMIKFGWRAGLFFEKKVFCCEIVIFF
jgi:hypothetical protein